jgi:methylase of polypeptide subunit release factors
MSAPPASLALPATGNPALLRAVPTAAQRILDVGCGTGALGQQFKQQQPTRTTPSKVTVHRAADCLFLRCAKMRAVAI